MKTFFLTLLISLPSFAARMCPVRTLEIVSCKEQGYVAISICGMDDGQMAMTYKHPAYPEVEIYPAERSDSQKQIIFKRIDIAPDSMELVINKSVDDYTRGFFRYSTAGTEVQLSMKCLKRYLD